MLLDSYKPHSLIFQITYDDAFELWDRAGAIARAACKIWPSLKLREGKPNYQTLAGIGVSVRIGLSDSTVTLRSASVFEASSIQSIQDMYTIWCEMLDLSVLKRASTRVAYIKDFETIKAANAELLGMRLTKWPDTKVFDQPLDGEANGLEIAYRFEDKASFSVLRIKADQIKAEVELDPELFDEPVLSKTQSRLVIDFDRGLLGSIEARKFRVDEWVKGFQHVLRRDLEKVLIGIKL